MTFRPADEKKRNYALNNLKDRMITHLEMNDFAQNLWARFGDKFLEEADCIMKSASIFRERGRTEGVSRVEKTAKQRLT